MMSFLLNQQEDDEIQNQL